MVLTKILAQFLSEDEKKIEEFWKFVKNNGYEKKVLQELVEKTEYWLRKRVDGSFSERYHYNQSGLNYTALSMVQSISLIRFLETKYVEHDEPMNRIGSTYKISVKDSEKKLSLEEAIDISQRISVFNDMGNSLMEAMIRFDISDQLNLKTNRCDFSKYVCVYYIEETEVINELKNDNLKEFLEISRKVSRHKYFHYKEKAETYLKELREEYQKNNVSLKLFSNDDGEEFLVGQTYYQHKHEFQILHEIVKKTIHLDEFGKRTLEMLNKVYRTKPVEKIKEKC